MALKSRNQNTKPAFEEDTDFDTAVAQADTEIDKSEPEVKQADAESKPTAEVKAAANAVVAKASRGLTPVGGGFKDPYRVFENAIELEAVRSFGPGTFPKMTADLGGLLINKEEIGKWAIVEVLSYNNRWVVAPGTMDDESKELFKISYDGKTVEGSGQDLHEYLEELKQAGYDKASIKTYVDMWALLVDSEEGGPIDTESQEMIHVQLSPNSAGKWAAFRTNQALRAARGSEVSARVKIVQERAKYGNNSWGQMTFLAA